MCSVLDVSKSGYYEWKKRKSDYWNVEDKDYQLKRDIENVFYNSRRAYGSPRVFHVIKGMGHKVSKSKVERLMRQLGLKAKKRRRYKKTTIGSKETQPSPNLVKQNFKEEKKGTVLLSDITYIPLKKSFAYLATVLDLATREIVGWRLEMHMEATLVYDALFDAYEKGHITANAIIHSDRGSQYGSLKYRKLVSSLGLRQSMSETGCCYDNAPMESFFDSLKTELMDFECFEDYSEARREIFEWIEVFYNRKRIHSSLDYDIPSCFAEKLLAKVG